jgi:carboxyl-terminal processing protease
VFIIKRILIIHLFIFSINCFSETKVLKKEDIRPTVEQMMLYHVENQQLTPAIIQRSFKVLIEQFDPEKLYFLQSEVEEYLNLSDSESKKVLTRFDKGDYKDFDNAFKLIKSAILRAKTIRLKKIAELKKEQYTEASQLAIDTSSYPMNKSHLLKKIEAQVISWLEAEMQTENFSSFTLEEKDRAINIYEKRIERHEAPYLGQNSQGVSLEKGQIEHLYASIIIKSFAKSLDAHTAFFSPEEAASMRASLQKQFRGIGVVLKEGGQGVYIADLIKGGPAYASKAIQKGDLLIAINGIKLKDKSFDEILELMQGKEGSPIKLTLERKNAAKPMTFDIALIRQKIIMDDERLTYSYEPFADGIIGKVKFDAFYDNGEGITTDRDLKEALKALREIGDLKGLVIDLRQNPGGFLSQAVKVAGVFIPKGIIAIAKYSTGEIQYSRDIDGRLFYQGPCVIMTSKASASAAEVVAQALQDYGAALIVGDERTYGKGSMQFQNITDDSAPAYFKVTVGRYYTISGRSTQIDGVISDIIVPSYFAPYPIGERFLQYPITRDDLGFSFVDPNNPLRKLSGFESDPIFSSYFTRQQQKWKSMLPKLVYNSKQRILANPSYADFINKSQAFQEGKKVRFDSWKEDFQLQESINIVKDMIILEKNNR